MDDALVEFAGEPLIFEVRGAEVTLDEFRRHAAEEPNAPTGVFAVLSANRQKRIESALV